MNADSSSCWLWPISIELEWLTCDRGDSWVPVETQEFRQLYCSLAYEKVRGFSEELMVRCFTGANVGSTLLPSLAEFPIMTYTLLLSACMLYPWKWKDPTTVAKSFELFYSPTTVQWVGNHSPFSEYANTRRALPRFSVSVNEVPIAQ